jgi:hypothetical protein
MTRFMFSVCFVDCNNLSLGCSEMAQRPWWRGKSNLCGLLQSVCRCFVHELWIKGKNSAFKTRKVQVMYILPLRKLLKTFR